MEQFLLQHPYLGLGYLFMICMTVMITASVLVTNQKEKKSDD